MTYYNTYAYFNELSLKTLYAIFVFICLVIVLAIFKFFIVKRLKKIAAHTQNDFDDVLVLIVSKINWVFYFAVSLYISLLFFKFNGQYKIYINTAFIIIVVYQVIRSISILIQYFTEKYQETHKDEDATGIIIFSKLIKLSLWFIALLLIISNLGYNITSLLAGLGIGGIAVALAVQNILDDIFSSVSIYFDKPFKVGDYIVVGEHSGTVKKIGMKTTRLQSPEGDELIIPNKEMTNTRIENFKRMQKRRVTFHLDLDKDNSVLKLKKAKQIIADIIANIKLTELESVHLKKLEGYKITYEIVYRIKSNKFLVYRDIQEEINLKIIQEFNKNKITFFEKVYILENKV